MHNARDRTQSHGHGRQVCHQTMSWPIASPLPTTRGTLPVAAPPALQAHQLSSHSVSQLFRPMVSICSTPQPNGNTTCSFILTHTPSSYQLHNSPKSSFHPPPMEHNSHHNAHVHSLHLILGGILAHVRPLLRSCRLPLMHVPTPWQYLPLLAHRNSPRHLRIWAPTRRPVQRPRSITDTKRGR